MTTLSMATGAVLVRAAELEPVEDALTAAEIETINAHGPFNHSVWRGRGVTISHEEGLAGRVEFLSRKVRQTIRENFSDEALAQMSIVDVGCYDGWLLESLSDLPFGRMVGIEPRLENIKRGRRVREILRIPSRVQYQVGEIDTLRKEPAFDIVLCMGVIHHLESIQAGLANLRAICGNLLIVDSLCLPSTHLTAELQRDVELKDFVYRYQPATFGITAQKFEGQYYPGSGVRFAVVNVPTAESLKMHLDVLGFQDIEVMADWKDFRAALPRNRRPIHEICLSALAGSEKDGGPAQREREWIADYERRMIATIVPGALIVPLQQRIASAEIVNELPEDLLLVYESLKERASPGSAADATVREIIASLSYCPIDKVRLEHGKHLLSRGDVAGAIGAFQQVTQRPSADWRSCYRAFYLLWRAHWLRDDSQAAHRSRECCLKCNPNFPSGLFDAPPPLQAAI